MSGDVGAVQLQLQLTQLQLEDLVGTANVHRLLRQLKLKLAHPALPVLS